MSLSFAKRGREHWRSPIKPSAQRTILYVGIRMNLKAAQLTTNGAEIVSLFARLALGVSFLSAVADRFGLLGPHGAKNVAGEISLTSRNTRARRCLSSPVH